MTSPSANAAPLRGRRSRLRRFTGRDKVWLWFMVGIPATLHILLVWVPAILTGVLSFFEWNNLDPVGKAKLVGFRNYWQAFTIFDNKLFPALFNNLALMVWLFACSAIGMLFAYLLDKGIRGSRFYQMVNYEQGLLNKLWPGGPIDFVGDQTKLFKFPVPFLDFDLGLSRNFAAILIAMAWRHIGYVMVMYLAGLKAVDPSLREAAAIDGCNEWQSFRRVVFPSLKPINVVVIVITVIEALRAYDMIAALNEPRGTEVMGTLVTNSLLGEGAGRVGLGSAYGMVLFILCIGFIIWYVINNFRKTDA